MAITLFPAPQKARFGKQTLDLSSAEWILVDPGASAALKKHAIAAADSLSLVLPSDVKVSAGAPARGDVLLTVELGVLGIPSQGYELATAGGLIVLRASDEAGAFYGLQTVHQILEQTGPNVPAFSISDWPDFDRRGVMLDISRCKVPTIETLLDLVDLLASVKVNEFQLYTEHTFAFSEHEAVWHDASPMTAEDILLLDAYCRDRYIDLVPNQNSFGHFERWLRHAEYRRYAECPNGFEYSWGGRSEFGSTLKPNRASLKLLESLYDELLPNFTSDRFNIGCDETWELGQGASRKRCEEKGKTRVYLDFLLQIHKLVQKHGRTMQFWGDIILHQPELIAELPKDIVALEWGYEFDHPFSSHCRRFAQAGSPFYVCPGTSSWRSLVGRTTNALGNLANAARNGLKHGAIGYLNTDWGDGGHHQYLPISYTGYFAGAAYSWCWARNKDADIASALDAMAFQDAGGKLGKLLMDMGGVCDLLPRRVFNATLYNNLLFADIGSSWLLEGVSVANLERSIAKFDALSEQIRASQPQCEDGDLVKDELLNAIAMARCGAERGIAGLDPARADRQAMRHALQHVISQHEYLWLARNRPGGLNESSGHLRAQLDKLT